MDDSQFEEALRAQIATGEETDAQQIIDTYQEEPAEEPQAEEPEAAADPDPETDPEPEEPQATERAPEVEAYLARHNGDIEAALKSAVHAKETVDRQGTELGELRKLVEQIAAEQQQHQAPQPAPFVPSDMQEAIDSDPRGVAEWAIQNQQPQVYEAALAEWYDQNPVAAGRFERMLEREMLKAELRQEIVPATEKIAEREQARVAAEAHRTLADKYPDFEQVLESATADEVAGIDRELLAAAQQQNPATALELVYRWVAAGRQQKAAEQAQRTEQVRQEKREAAVVTADASPATQTEPTVMERLAASMLDPEPQSVAHGLRR